MGSTTLLVQTTNTHTGCSEVFRSEINLDVFSAAFSHRYVGHALVYDVYIKRGTFYVTIGRERARVSNRNHGFATFHSLLTDIDGFFPTGFLQSRSVLNPIFFLSKRVYRPTRSYRDEHIFCRPN